MAKRTKSIKRAKSLKMYKKKKNKILTARDWRRVLIVLLFVTSVVINIIVFTGLQDGSLVKTEVEILNVGLGVQVPVNVKKPVDMVLTLSIVQLGLAFIRVLIGVNSPMNINSIVAHSIIVISLLNNVFKLNLVSLVELYTGLDMITNVFGGLTAIFLFPSRFLHLFNAVIAVMGVVFTFNLIRPIF